MLLFTLQLSLLLFLLSSEETLDANRSSFVSLDIIDIVVLLLLINSMRTFLLPVYTLLFIFDEGTDLQSVALKGRVREGRKMGDGRIITKSMINGMILSARALTPLNV